MPEIQPYTIADVHGYKLSVNNSFVTILTDWGCNINRLVLSGEEILDGYQTKEDISTNFYSQSDFLLPFPNRIADGTYRANGETYHLKINETERNNSLHGLITQKAFTLNSQSTTDTSATAVFEAEITNDEFQGYPFDLKIVISITLSEKQLDVSIKTTNIGTTTAPYGVGWHPYLLAPKSLSECMLEIPADSMLETDQVKELIPTGKLTPNTFGTEKKQIGDTEFDTCFTDLTDNKITFENREVYFDGTMKYVQFYIPPTRDSIAVEPMSCAPDAFNNQLGLILLKPETSTKHNFGISLV